MIQTYQVIERLRQQWPDLEITIEQIHTRGDHITDVPLSQIGGDGIFVTEIERALHEKRIDVAVHSLKDLPTIQPVDLRLVILGPREDVRDVFVAHEQGLQPGNNIRIGTCSLRRMAQVRSLYPDAHILSIRGNVDTRLRKLEAHQYDGILLAAAGLHRLLGVDPIRALFVAAIINGLVAPPLLVLIVLLGSDRKIMKGRVSGPVSRTLTWIATGVMSSAAVALLVTLIHR